MAILSHQCPHCLVDNIALRIVHAYTGLNGNGVVALMACPKCKMGSVALLDGVAPQNIDRTESDVRDMGAVIRNFWPDPPRPTIPEHLPPSIERVYLQAERNFPVQGNEEAAGTMYRKVLDLAVKQIEPTATGMLGPKLKALTKAGKLTADLAQWADSVRELGNEAAHDDHAIAREDLEDLRGFTEMVVRYLFTLPGMIKKRRGEPLPWEVGGTNP